MDTNYTSQHPHFVGQDLYLLALQRAPYLYRHSKFQKQPYSGVNDTHFQEEFQVSFSPDNFVESRIGLSHGVSYGKFTVLFIIPAAIAVYVFAVRILQPIVRGRPKWTQPFVREAYDSSDVPTKIQNVSKGDRNIPCITLFSASILGLVAGGTRMIFPVLSLVALPQVLSWVAVTCMTLLDRPKCAPIGLLAILVSLLAVDLTILAHTRDIFHLPNIASILEPFFALSAIIVILGMPLRNPDLPTCDISLPFQIPTHELRSPEDHLTLWQFMTVSWMSPLISVGSARQLHEEDVWSLSFEFQHRTLHDLFRDLRGSVVRRLLVANGLDLLIITVLGLLEAVANAAIPVLLQQLLRSMEDPTAPLDRAVTYAALSLLVRLIACQSSVFDLWYSRRCYERSRGEMITMLFEKTLRRKMISGSNSISGTCETTSNGSVSQSGVKQSRSKVKVLFERLQRTTKQFFRSKKAPADIKQHASMGKIVNLMRNDVYEVSQRFWEFQDVITKPLEAIFSIILIWKLIGWPCLLGVLTVFAAQGVNALITRVLLHWERKRRKATDDKLQKINQFVEAIRHLRWYGWQNFWQDQIMDSRQHELYLRVITSLWRNTMSFSNSFASGMFPVAAFYAYTALAGQPLRIDIAFPALQLFNMLESSLRSIPDLITTFLNAKIAVDRIEEFMAEPDKEDLNTPFYGDSDHFNLQEASFAWPGNSELVLRNLNLTFPVGMTIVYGKVAAGKTALLQALLGELDSRGGVVIRPDKSIGYCAQSPWLQSMSIKENILFSNPLEDDRYRQVLDACALTPDLANLKDGDLSEIGENGIGLSGGQKARVALARAVYSRAKILLLDDPLSALDYQTAETIMRRCFGGPLLHDRTVIMVTHRLELCRALAVQIVEISNGRAKMLKSEQTILQGFDEEHHADPIDDSGHHMNENPQSADAPKKFTAEEHRAHGGVKAAVYWEYIKAGKIKWWVILISLLALWRVIALAETWFLKEWGEAYGRSVGTRKFGQLHALPSPEANIRPWLVGFFILALGKSCMFFVSQSFMLVIIYSAGRQMFRDIMIRVSHATFRFYDVTPVGRLMNRMTSDIGTIDGNISQHFQLIAWQLITWVSSIMIVASVTPTFLIFSVILTVLFVSIFLRFLPTSQSLRRLEMVSLSPLMSNFGALLEGLTTVRAFGVQGRFQDRVIAVVDAFQRMDHFYWSLQSWLMYRFDALSACSTFLITLLAIYTGIGPGLTAFVLIAADQFVNATHSLCRGYGRLQMEFVSVERVVELLHLEQEPPGTIDPPAAWPTYTGDIVFEGVTMRYAPHLDPSLSNISLRVPGGSTTALLGRTGSGKSTLALALLATTRPESGRILLDGVNISEVNTQILRERVTFLAQDPVLFPGSMRQNLDPVNEYSDDACESVLDRLCGTHGWTIDTKIDAGGRNLSQGQRQLVGLARAALRRSSVIILDEATASIDTESAMQIQQILRDEMKESTVITIAHRLEAVKNADYYIRLDKGRVVAQGSATEHMMDSQDTTE